MNELFVIHIMITVLFLLLTPMYLGTLVIKISGKQTGKVRSIELLRIGVIYGGLFLIIFALFKYTILKNHIIFISYYVYNIITMIGKRMIYNSIDHSWDGRTFVRGVRLGIFMNFIQKVLPVTIAFWVLSLNVIMRGYNTIDWDFQVLSETS